jgi:hypothetical protein
VKNAVATQRGHVLFEGVSSSQLWQIAALSKNAGCIQLLFAFKTSISFVLFFSLHPDLTVLKDQMTISVSYAVFQQEICLKIFF